MARPAAPAAKPAPPAAAAPSAVAAAPQAQSGGMLSGIGSTIMQGMAFGTGSAIAHRAVGAVAESFSGSGSTEAAAPAPEYAAGAMTHSNNSNLIDACSMDKTMFYDCLQQNKGDQQACHFLYEQLKECQQNSTQFS